MKTNSNPSGFAGFQELTTDIPALWSRLIADADQEAAERQREEAAKAATNTSPVAGGRNTRHQSSALSTSGLGDSTDRLWYWFKGLSLKAKLGIVGGIIYVAALIFTGSKQTEEVPPPPPPPAAEPAPAPAPAYPAPSSYSGSGSRVVAHVGRGEVKPPVGSGRALSYEEVLYCRAENARLEAIKDGLDSNFLIARFNTLVEDYNSRCGHFKYRSGVLESADSEVRARSSEIAEQARRRVETWQMAESTGQDSIPPPTDIR